MRRDRGRRPADRARLTGVGMGLMALLLVLTMLVESGFDLSAVSVQLGLGGPQASETASGSPGAAAPPVTQVRDQGGRFDYYILALSWSPSFCEGRPDARQCGKGHRFVLHGLWPQYERGYPEDCSDERLPSALLAEFDGLTVSRGLLAHQWRRHGSCTGLTPQAYFRLMGEAARRVTIPPALDKAARSARVDPKVVEAAFLQANPGLKRDQITITCKSGDFAEARICLDKSLEPRRCGADVIRDCPARMIDLPAPRR